MLISKSVKTKPVNNSYIHFKNLGYDSKYREEIEVPVHHLPKTSSIKVDVKCEGGCDKTYSIEYRSYLYSIEFGYLNEYCCKSCSNKISFNRENNPIFRDGCIEKKEKTRKKTCLERYGVDCVLKDKTIQSRIKNTRLEKYGTEIIDNIPGVQDKIRKTKELNGSIIPLTFKSEWEKYSLECQRLTKRVKQSLLEIWDGHDYYDGEYIKDNFDLEINDRNYPTIDHIIPKIYGFLNNIEPKEICKLENLCITKRTFNCSKKSMEISEFKTIKGLK